MKSYRKELWFETSTRRAFINITDQIEKCLNESGIKEGLILINAMHITSSVFINDDESRYGVHQIQLADGLFEVVTLVEL